MYESELDHDDEGDTLSGDLPTYAELAFGWRENEPPDEPPKPRRLGYVGMFLLFCLIMGVGLSVLSHQQYDMGYQNGGRDAVVQAYSAGEQVGMGIGYQDGEGQGRMEAIVDLQEWEDSHKCAVTNGYVSLKVARDDKGQVVYSCVMNK